MALYLPKLSNQSEAATIYLNTSSTKFNNVLINLNNSLTNLNNALIGSLAGISTSTIGMTAGNMIQISTTTSAITIAVTSTPSFSSLIVSGTGVFNTVSSTNINAGNLNISLIATSTNIDVDKITYPDATFQTTNERCDIAFMIENPTSTNALDLNGDLFPMAFPVTSTITRVLFQHRQAGQSATVNLTYNADATSATTTFSVFATNQTINTTTSTIVLPNASSTPNQFDSLRVSFSAASTTQFRVQTCYKTR